MLQYVGIKGVFYQNPKKRGIAFYPGGQTANSYILTLQNKKELAKTVFEGELLKTYIELSKIAFILMVIIYAA